MKISFDGNVFTGKTSLVEACALIMHGNVIQEHGYFLEKEKEAVSHAVADNTAAMSLQLRYLDAEKKRGEFFKQFEKNETNLLDRSFVSMATHVFALNEVLHIDIRDWFLESLQKQADAGDVLIPDIFCFVTCSREVLQQRLLANSSRGTDSVYYSKDYLDAVEYFNVAWIEKTGGLAIDTTALLPIVLAKTLTQRIASCSQEKCTAQNVAVFVRDVFNQTRKS